MPYAEHLKEDAFRPETGQTLFPRGLAQAEGAHFSLDALLLACFAPEADAAVDLGAGCGVVGLGLLLLRRTRSVLALELDSDQAEAARENARTLGFAEACTVRVCDVFDPAAPSASADAPLPLAVTNPPWRIRGAERLPASPRRQHALYGTAETLPRFAQAAARRLERGGAFCSVTGAYRLPDLLAAMAAAGLSPSRLRCVHPRPGSPAGFVLVEARNRVSARMVVEPPLFLHGPGHAQAYTSEAVRFCPWLERADEHGTFPYGTPQTPDNTD